MRRLEEILRTQYIGAITIGFLLFQAAAELINIILQPILTYMQNRGRPQSILAASPGIFNWPQVVLGFIAITLHLIIAGLLILWLYRKGKSAQPAPAAAPTGETKAPS